MAAIADDAHHVQPLLAQLLREAFFQHVGEAFHEHQRCPQVMGDGIGEGFQIPVGCGQFFSVQPFPFLQRGVLAAQSQQVQRPPQHRQG